MVTKFASRLLQSMHMATVPLTLHGCCFLISWLIHTFIFLLLSTHCNGTQISYSDHCASVVPESTATAPEFASLPFLHFQNGYYNGGDRILDPNPSKYSSNKHNLLLFHTQNVYALMLKVSSNLRGICTSTTRTILDTVGLMVIHSSRL